MTQLWQFAVAAWVLGVAIYVGYGAGRDIRELNQRLNRVEKQVRDAEQ